MRSARATGTARLAASRCSFFPCTLGLALLLLSPRGLLAQETPMPAKLRVAFALKTIEYDLNMKGRAPGGPRILVVGLTDQGVSATEAQEMTQEFVSYFGKQPAGAGSAEKILVGNALELRKKLDERPIHVMVLAQSLGALSPALIGYAQEKKILVLSSERKQLEDGAAVCFLLKGGRPKILIRVKAAVAQGANFDPRLLRLAEVVDRV